MIQFKRTVIIREWAQRTSRSRWWDWRLVILKTLLEVEAVAKIENRITPKPCFGPRLTVIFMVKDQLSILNHLKLNNHFLPLLVSCPCLCLMTSWHFELLSCQDDCGCFMTRDTSLKWLSRLDISAAFSLFSDWLQIVLAGCHPGLWLSWRQGPRCGEETMGPCQWSVMMLRGQPPVRSLLSSVGLRRESRQSVVSWRSDSEDVTYSRSQPAKCNCAIMPWWQSVCETLPTICNKNRLS